MPIFPKWFKIKFLRKENILGLSLILGIAIFSVSFIDSKEDLPKPEYEAFQLGEKLTFDLSYAFISAGEGTFQVLPEPKLLNGKPHWIIDVVGKSYKFFDPFFKVRDYYKSYIDPETKLPSYYYRNTSEGGYNQLEGYRFNQSTKEIDFGGGKFGKGQSTIFDIISCFYYVRCIDFSTKKPGYEVNMITYFDKEPFPVGVVYEGKTTIKTSLGRFKVLQFRPKLIAGRVFKNQADMTLYVSDDKNQVPLRIKSAIYLDYVYADLVKFEGLKYPLNCKIKK